MILCILLKYQLGMYIKYLACGNANKKYAVIQYLATGNANKKYAVNKLLSSPAYIAGVTFFKER